MSKAQEFLAMSRVISKLGVVIPLKQEAKTLRKKSLAIHLPESYSEQLLICRSGVGYENAYKASMNLIAQGATALLSFGCAGALSSNLLSGDLLIPECIQDPNNQEITVDLALRQKFVALLPKSEHKILSANHAILHVHDMLVDAQQKGKMSQESEANAVDMESLAVAKVAKEHEIPFFVVRVILDEAEFNFPQCLLKSLNQHGQVNYFKFLFSLIKNPHEIKVIYSLIKRWKLVHAKLKFLAQYIKQFNLN